MDIIGTIAMVLMFAIGALCFFAPKKCTRADMRDDAKAVSQVKNTGIILMVGAVGAGLMVLKYKLR